MPLLLATLIVATALGPGAPEVDLGASLPDGPRADQPMTQWRIPGAGPRPAAGKMLVSHSGMLDPNFAETVVLLIAYDEGGALGLVINRRAEVELKEILPDVEPLEERDDPVYLGGPVDRSRMFLLVRSDKPLELARPVVDDVHVSESPALLEQLLEKGNKAEFRAYAGYAGWGAGQLDGELERGDWHIVDGTADRIFTDRPAALWRKLLPRNKMEWSRLLRPAE